MIDENEINNLNWWHRIKLSDNIITPGKCNHGTTSEEIENRFGFPKNFDEKNVLDVGGYDGLFSFEAEKRKAKYVTMIDSYQNSFNKNPNEPFQIVKKILKSKVRYIDTSLEEYETNEKFDYIFYFGVLYHIENPLGAIKKLADLVDKNGIVLLETAISGLNIGLPILEYKPNFDNDPTNFFYPNKEWVEASFKEYNAKKVTLFYSDGIRGTFRIEY